MLIETHDEVCKGLLLFKAFGVTIHLWYCPTGYQIQKHNHPNQSIELMFLYGDTVFHKISNGLERSIRVLGISCRCFTIRPDEVHWADKTKRPLVFLNFAKWKKGVSPTSASRDFNLVS
jgi:hypothetical protein